MENQELLLAEFIETQMQLINWELTTYELYNLWKEKIQKKRVESIAIIEDRRKNPEKYINVDVFVDPDSDNFLPLSGIEQKLESAIPLKQIEILGAYLSLTKDELNSMNFKEWNKKNPILAIHTGFFLVNILQDFYDGYDNKKLSSYKKRILEYINVTFAKYLEKEERIRRYGLHKNYENIFDYIFKYHVIRKEVSFNDFLIDEIGYLVELWERKKFAEEKIREFEHEDKEEDNTPLPDKLKWLGTPAEFGAIFSKLIECGYIQGYSSITTTARIANKFFNITTNKREPVADRTLEDYLGRNKKELFDNKPLKIPNSDNLGKE